VKFFSRRKAASPERSKVPVYITLQGKDQLIRLWVDKNMHPYKVELRMKNFQGYLDVDEFLKRLKI